MAHLRRERLIGVGLVVLSALAWSLNGLYTRLLTVDVWTTLAGRAIAAVIMIGIVLLIKHRAATSRLIAYNIRHGAIVILCGAASMMTFVAALFTTTVAN